MKELKFIHITKCAGSFIENIGKIHNLEWGMNHSEYGFWHGLFKNINIKVKNKYDWFMIVRNPYDRILSEYYCKYSGIAKRNVNHNIEEFNSFLIRKIRNRNIYNGKDLSPLGHHYTEQYKYLDSSTDINVIHLEKLNYELQILFKKYNLDINLECLKKTNTKGSNNNIIKFSIHDFSNELIELINEVYHLDFKLFKYRKLIAF
jgi:hypothetical protein